MSIRLMTAVWDLDLPAGEKIVLLALADQANDEGRQCWPSVETIMKRSGQGERTVRRALLSLEEKGHLVRNFRANDSTQYHILPCQNGTPAKLAPVPKTTARGAKSAPKPSRTTNIPQKTSSSSVERASKPTRVPSNFTPRPAPGSLTEKAMAAWPPGEVEQQVEHFIDYHTLHETLSKDWQISWRTWVKNWKTFNGNRPGRLSQQPDLSPDWRLRDGSIDPLAAALREAHADCAEGPASYPKDDPGAWLSLPAVNGR